MHRFDTATDTQTSLAFERVGDDDDDDGRLQMLAGFAQENSTALAFGYNSDALENDCACFTVAIAC